MTEEKKVFLERSKEKVLDHLANLVAGAVGVLLVIICKALAPDVIPLLSSPRMQKVLAPLLGISIILNILFGLCIWVIKPKPKFRVKYGVNWDRDLQPFCPTCENPMQWGDWVIGGFGLLCTKCNQTIQLSGDDGKEILIGEARDELNKKSSN